MVWYCSSLLVSSCSVDSGSPAEEAGLQVGDQVMDVNGHSFISIQHQEAVHILRSYQNLILTIKVYMAVINNQGCKSQLPITHLFF